MGIVYTPYALPLLLVTLLTAVVISYIWPRRHVSGAWPLILIAGTIAIWSTAYAFELVSPTISQKMGWARVSFIGISLMPYFWLWFSLAYVNKLDTRPWLRPLLYTLALFPITTILLGFTNSWHNLLWAEVSLTTIRNLPQLQIIYGSWFWVHFVTSYTFLLFGTGLLLTSLWTKKGLYRGQVIALLIAIFAPWLSNILFFANLSPIPGLDLTPFAFSITVVALTWALFGYQLINVTPIARDLIIENMREGLLVINRQGQITDINPAAARLIGLPDTQAVGKQATDVLLPWPHVLALLAEKQEARGELISGKKRYHFQIAHLSGIDGQLLGYLITTQVRRHAPENSPDQPQPAPTPLLPTPTAFKTNLLEAPPAPFAPTTTRWKTLLSFFFPHPLENIEADRGQSKLLRQMLEQAFTMMLRFATVLSMLTLSMLALAVLGGMDWPSLFWFFTLTTAVLGFLSYQRALNFNYRIYAFLILLLALSLGELLNYGFSSETFLFFSALTIFSTLLQGQRIGLLVGTTSLICLLLISRLITLNLFQPWAIDIPLLSNTVITPTYYPYAITSILVWVATMVPILILITSLMHSVNTAWWQENQAKNLLQQERDTLDQRVLERTQALRNREAILDAVSFSTSQLLHQRAWQKTIPHILSKLGQAVNVSRTYLFEKHRLLPSQTLYISQRYEWTAPGITPQIDNPDLQNMPVTELISRWLSIFERGELIHSLVADMPPDEQALLAPQNILSIALMPIMVRGQWWGFIGFDDCVIPREWTNSELEALIVATNNLGAAIERQQQEEELAQTARELSKAQAIGHMGNWEWDIKTQEVSWSDEHYQLFGLPPQSITPTRDLFRKAIHPEDKALAETALREALNGTPYNMEYRIFLPDGRVRHMHSWAELIHDAQGQPLRLSGVIQDITERKEAETALQAYADKLARLTTEQQIILDNSPAAIFLQKGTQIVWANPATTRILGYTIEELKQLPNNNHYPSPEAYQALVDTVESTLVRGESATAETQLRHKDGSLFWVFVSGQAVNVERIYEDGILWIMQDITKRKEAEAALEAYAEQLAEARDQALEASQYKSLLLSKVSHELRTPLGGIIGYAELLHDDLFGEMPAEQLEFVKRIIQNGHHLDGLIDDLLDQAQIEQGTIQIEPFPTSIPDMCHFLQGLLSPLATQKGLTISITADPALPEYAMLDEKRLRQIVINLVNNAIKFTEMGGVTVTFSRLEQAYWQIEVTDTGPGIPPEAQQKIFDSFWQANRAAKGYGLGLSIVYQLARLMEGRVWVESEPGQGSTFKVLLPLVESEAWGGK